MPSPSRTLKAACIAYSVHCLLLNAFCFLPSAYWLLALDRRQKSKAPGCTLTAQPGARDTDGFGFFLFQILHRNGAQQRLATTPSPS